MNGVCRHPHDLRRLCDDGVDAPVDPDAPVARALARLLGEPVVAVPPSQHFDDGQLEFLQLGVAPRVLPPDEVN